ncbi:MAG: TIGR02996 domain-containing protein [Gemmataceae bacterium]
MPRRTPPNPLPTEPYWKRVPDSQGLLYAIAEEPDDLSIRLILADLLEEHGETARAEFMRLQVQCLQWPEGDSQRKELEQRANLLLDQHREVWTQGLPAIKGTWCFYGGLIEGVELGSRALEVLPAVYQVVDLRRLCIGNNQSLEEVLNRKVMANLSMVYPARRTFEAAVAEAFANSPHLANLTWLLLMGIKIGNVGAHALAQSPHLANLTRLCLGGNEIGDTGAQALAQSSHLSNLTRLDLAMNKIRDAGAQALAQSPYLANLTRLDLGGNEIGDASAEALANSPYLTNLTRLHLHRTRIGVVGKETLAQAPYLRKCCIQWY